MKISEAVRRYIDEYLTIPYLLTQKNHRGANGRTEPCG